MVYWAGNKLGTTWPKKADKTDITKRDEKAPANTTSRECFIAMMAAIKNVLSPISDTMIIKNESIKPCCGVVCDDVEGDMMSGEPSSSRYVFPARLGS